MRLPPAREATRRRALTEANRVRGRARADGGGGISRVLSGGNVFEKAGCSLSVVYGSMPAEALASATERGVDRAKGMKPGERVPFFACGLSSVMHPRNPHAPTMHFNYRYFETDGGVWWFGGGTDITPAYLYEDDMRHFHGTYKAVCDKHDPAFYAKFKKWADEYFVIKHRGETRGLGGIFFDDLNDRPAEDIFKFSTECANSVVDAYVPLVRARKDTPFTEAQREWQQIRRGRYVEFNLVYDRGASRDANRRGTGKGFRARFGGQSTVLRDGAGARAGALVLQASPLNPHVDWAARPARLRCSRAGTIFGLKTGGRIESILMSLPETSRWEYGHTPVAGTPEAEIMDCFKKPRTWV